MQLKTLEFRGYKPFPGGGHGTETKPQRFDLAPLTIVFGKNNSGKSAVVRLPRLILGALAGEEEDLLPLEVRGHRFGGRFLDLVHGGDFLRRPSFRVVGERAGETLDFEMTLFTKNALSGDEPPELWSYSMSSPRVLEIPRFPDRQEPAPPFLGLLPASEDWDSWRFEASELLDEMVHLGPMRADIPLVFSEEKPEPISSKGAECAQWLRVDSELERLVGEWFEHSMDGWRLLVQRNNESFHLQIKKGKILSCNLANAGAGLQQVLPIVVHSLLRRRSTKPFLDLVEQPELHLHDAAQAPLVDLWIETANAGVGQTVVETHSEPILLRLQRRIAEGVIAPERVALYFVEGNVRGSVLRRVLLDDNGEVDWWPEGVFGEDFAEVAAMRRAQRLRFEGSVGSGGDP